ncbi:unnamed protein product [Ilex paraguariensis]|uniref:Dicer-like 1 n=1 Tax=Ilex paraguariensis TaxID=185542 RepID=A0ABC8RF75_9AQUA
MDDEARVAGSGNPPPPPSSYWLDACEDISCDDFSHDLVDFDVPESIDVGTSNQDSSPDPCFFGGIDRILDSIKNGGGLPSVVDGTGNGLDRNGSCTEQSWCFQNETACKMQIEQSCPTAAAANNNLSNGLGLQRNNQNILVSRTSIETGKHNGTDNGNKSLDGKGYCGKDRFLKEIGLRRQDTRGSDRDYHENEVRYVKRPRLGDYKNERHHSSTGQYYPRERPPGRKRLCYWEEIDKRGRDQIRKRERYGRRDGRDRDWREGRGYWERDRSGSNEMVFRLGAYEAARNREGKTPSEKNHEDNGGGEENKTEDPKEKLPEEQARQYQLDVLEQAKKKNTIAFLETGAGKTLIAVLLIKSVCNELQKQNKKMLAVFLVPKVPLVYQQAEVIRERTGFRVGHYCGEMGQDFWDTRRWQREFETKEVFVMTAQILLNILRHSIIKMEAINLLILDECHHAVKKHPYSLVMSEFYHTTPKEKRPSVFGMTASPVNLKGVSSQVDCAIKIRNLESKLDSVVCTIKDRKELEKYVPMPSEVVVEYDKAASLWSLHEQIKQMELAVEEAAQSSSRRSKWQFMGARDAGAKEELRQVYGVSERTESDGAANLIQKLRAINYALGELGQWCAYKVAQSFLTALQNDERVNYQLDVKFQESYLNKAVSLLQCQLSEGAVSENISKSMDEDNDLAQDGGGLDDIEEGELPDSHATAPSSLVFLRFLCFAFAVVFFFDRKKTIAAASTVTVPVASPAAFPVSTTTTELMIGYTLTFFSYAGIILLVVSGGEHVDVIIGAAVADGKVTPKVQSLIKILLKYQHTQDFRAIIFVERVVAALVLPKVFAELPSLCFIKSASLIGHNNSQEMRTCQMQDTIARFRDGRVTLLVATSVAEEGLDIRQCNVVIRFDLAKTVLAYIQSRGRARKPGSDYILMVERGNLSHEAFLRNARNSEETLRKEAIERTDLSHLQGTLKLVSAEATPGTVYQVESTGAVVSLNSAVGLIHFYCSQLPSDRYSILRPEFIMERHEKPGGPTEYSCRLQLPCNAPFEKLEGPVCSSMRLAQQAVCLAACKKVHEMGAFTDMLLPDKGSGAESEKVDQSEEGDPLPGTARHREFYPEGVPDILQKFLILRDAFILLLENEPQSATGPNLEDERSGSLFLPFPNVNISADYRSTSKPNEIWQWVQSCFAI